MLNLQTPHGQGMPAWSGRASRRAHRDFVGADPAFSDCRRHDPHHGMAMETRENLRGAQVRRLPSMRSTCAAAAGQAEAAHPSGLWAKPLFVAGHTTCSQRTYLLMEDKHPQRACLTNYSTGPHEAS
jgi:hypothetical protein